MSRRIRLLLAFVVAAPSAVQSQSNGQTVPVVAETRIDILTREIASQLRCPVCQGLSLQDSPSSLAQDMRGVIHEQLEAGKTPEEVKQYFVASYGEWILLVPEASGFNLAVFVLPILAVLIGLAVIVLSARRWLRTSPHTPQTPPIDDSDADLAPWEEITTR